MATSVPRRRKTCRFVWALITASRPTREIYVSEPAIIRRPCRPLTENAVPVFTSVSKISTCTGTRHHCALTRIRCRWTCLTTTHCLDTYRARSSLRISIATYTVVPCRPAGHLKVSVCTFIAIETCITKKTSPLESQFWEKEPWLLQSNGAHSDDVSIEHISVEMNIPEMIEIRLDMADFC